MKSLNFSYKTATYIVNTILILVAACGLFMIYNFPPPVLRLAIGPGYYPALLFAALIITSVISSIKTFRSSNDQMLVFPKIKNTMFVIVTFVAFWFFWEKTRQFYIVSFIAIGILLYFLNPQPSNVGRVVKAVVISLCIQVFVYVVFQRLMHFRF